MIAEQINGRAMVDYRAFERVQKELEAAQLINAQLSAMVGEMRGALEFYAEPASWSITEGHELRTVSSVDLEMADEPTPWGAKATYMAGKQAREALKLTPPDALKEVLDPTIKALRYFAIEFASDVNPAELMVRAELTRLKKLCGGGK